MCDAVLNFFNSRYMLKEVNQTFITIILKEHRPDSVTKFIPISLYYSSYKIISKGMAGRLKAVMPSIVGDFQNALVSGRLLADNCFIAHELVNLVKKRKKVNVFESILKVVPSKAYDRVNWDFLANTLRTFNFPTHWIH